MTGGRRVRTAAFLARASARISAGMLGAAAVWAFLISFAVVADVVGRTFFDTPVKGTPEIIATSMVIIVFLQAGYAIRSGSMLRAGFVLDRLGPRARRILEVGGHLLGAAFFALVAIGSWEFALESLASGEYEGEGSLRIPSWPSRLAVLFGSALAALDYGVLAGLAALGAEGADDGAAPAARG